jgi:SAM-dependent methyltransferase
LDYIKPESIFSDKYVYFSSFSTSWVRHAELYVNKITNLLKLNNKSQVIEIACNDGYLLQFFQKANIPCLGVEPSSSTANAAREKGIEVIEDFFGLKLVPRLPLADLIVGNNVIAHVPNILDFVGAIKLVLKPSGTATFEFPHLLRLIQKTQFDTIYHEHFSYFSLFSINNILESFNLKIYDVEELQTHGGSLRIYVTHDYNNIIQSHRYFKIYNNEIKFGITNLHIYDSFESKTNNIKNNLLQFLIKINKKNNKIYGYGAAAKGNTLLNYAGVKKDLLPLIIDKSPHKQGLFMPQSHIPIVSDSVLKDRPDYILILPWNLKEEITTQLNHLREQGTKFVVAIPKLQIF